MILADLLSRAQDLATRGESYPVWARVLFVATFALLLVSAFVYAVLYARVGDDSKAKETLE